jgi:hypothetical protein
MEEKSKKSRGVKKGQTPTWKVGRKKKEEKIKYVSKSVSLPNEKWEKLEEIAKNQGTTKNKLIANLVENFLNIFEKK